MGGRITDNEAEQLLANARANGIVVEEQGFAMRAEIDGPRASPAPQKATRTGRGVRREPGQMNGLEKKYAKRLDQLKQDGTISEWHFEAVKLRLAAATFYTPDFMVMDRNGEISFHETKGFWRDDAKIKIKVAAELFPFVFMTVQFDKKAGWRIHEVTGKLKG